MSDLPPTDVRDDEMLVAYRHDAHKFYGTPHESARETLAGVPVNRSVPYSADWDAASLSRPSGTPDQTVANHRSHYRVSLLDGTSQEESEWLTERRVERAVQELLFSDDPIELHQTWLGHDVASMFNESVYYPYTSLKYHTLLVAALLDAYRAGHQFSDLLLIVDAADEIVPHRTIYAGDRFTLRLGTDPDGQPAARLGSRPWRSWAATWTRLTSHPLDADEDPFDRVLDANLRRIGAWSTALQYLEDMQSELQKSG